MEVKYLGDTLVTTYIKILKVKFTITILRIPD